MNKLEFSNLRKKMHVFTKVGTSEVTNKTGFEKKNSDLPTSTNHPNCIRLRKIKLDYVGLLESSRILFSFLFSYRHYEYVPEPFEYHGVILP